jgi:hypothetical protein
MAYWLDEAWHRWLQIDEAGTAAAGLYARCGSYIADEGTDGFIPAARARMYGTPEWIQRLVEVGLWTVEEKGFRDVRYLELNVTKAEVEKRKKQAAQRQARYYDRVKRQSRASDASSDASVTGSPFPAPPYGGKGGRTGRRALRGGPSPPAGGRFSPHTYDDDGTGSCLVCLLPFNNEVHSVGEAS